MIVHLPEAGYPPATAALPHRLLRDVRTRELHSAAAHQRKEKFNDSP